MFLQANYTTMNNYIVLEIALLYKTLIRIPLVHKGYHFTQLDKMRYIMTANK